MEIGDRCRCIVCMIRFGLGSTLNNRLNIGIPIRNIDLKFLSHVILLFSYWKYLVRIEKSTQTLFSFRPRKSE